MWCLIFTTSWALSRDRKGPAITTICLKKHNFQNKHWSWSSWLIGAEYLSNFWLHDHTTVTRQTNRPWAGSAPSRYQRLPQAATCQWAVKKQATSGQQSIKVILNDTDVLIILPHRLNSRTTKLPIDTVLVLKSCTAIGKCQSCFQNTWKRHDELFCSCTQYVWHIVLLFYYGQGNNYEKCNPLMAS